MSNNSEPLFRHELKYVISAAQLSLLKARIEPIMELDSHAGVNGIYNIRSLYFDDYYNRCLLENENGTDPREKFRIRIYNGSDDFISLECKRKERGKTLKTSCRITREQAEGLINLSPVDSIENAPQPMRKLLLEMQTHLMRPAVIVDYDRVPYVYRLGNVRITFDTAVSSCDDFDSFFNERINARPIMPKGMELLEVKFDEFLPDYIYNALNLEMLSQTAYSKYYLCRKQSIDFNI